MDPRKEPAARVFAHPSECGINGAALPLFPKARSRSDDTAGTCIRTTNISANGKATCVPC
jgi:hypothetical protein